MTAMIDDDNVSPYEMYEEVDRLNNIQDEIRQLTHEAMAIVRHVDMSSAQEAGAHWYAHILAALGGQNSSSSALTMSDTIYWLEAQIDDIIERRENEEIAYRDESGLDEL